MKEEDDPILKMRGVGKEMWTGTGADEYVRDLRSNWYGDRRDSKTFFLDVAPTTGFSPAQ